MKKIILTVLMVASMFLEAQAEEPTIEETVAFIQKVLKDKKKTANQHRYVQEREKADKIYIWEKPSFNFIDNNCKLEVTHRKHSINDKFSGYTKKIESTEIYFIDLSKSKILVNLGADGWNKFMVRIEDREGKKVEKTNVNNIHSRGVCSC